MKIGLKANHQNYHTFDTTHTKHAISIIKGTSNKPYCLFSRTKQESQYERAANIAIGSIKLIPSILYDIAISSPINLTYRNIKVMLLNKHLQSANNQRKVVRFYNFAKKHSVLTKTILTLAVTITLVGACYYSKGTIASLLQQQEKCSCPPPPTYPPAPTCPSISSNATRKELQTSLHSRICNDLTYKLMPTLKSHNVDINGYCPSLIHYVKDCISNGMTHKLALTDLSNTKSTSYADLSICDNVNNLWEAMKGHMDDFMSYCYSVAHKTPSDCLKEQKSSVFPPPTLHGMA
jgi:hypothetical protein